jgi:hypothetical protein
VGWRVALRQRPAAVSPYAVVVACIIPAAGNGLQLVQRQLSDELDRFCLLSVRHFQTPFWLLTTWSTDANSATLVGWAKSSAACDRVGTARQRFCPRCWALTTRCPPYFRHGCDRPVNLLSSSETSCSEMIAMFHDERNMTVNFSAKSDTKIIRFMMK